MNKDFSITNIFASKKVKIAISALAVVTAVSAFSASTYFSFRKEQAKNLKKIQATEQARLPKEEKRKPIDKTKFKHVNISGDLGSQNPFDSDSSIPVAEGIYSSDDLLAPPPLGGITDSDAGKVSSTTVSGIMYDSYNPSAIINIEGTDYFVKKNDVIDNYKILSIAPKKVVVQLGKNIYQAGVGELLTEVSSNSNIVNLNNKFGGNQQSDIPINIRKR